MEISQAMSEIKKGAAEIIGEAQIAEMVERYYKTGQNFYVKIGMDPTAPDLHLGHSVVLMKLATLQKHGAIVIFLIGDFTGQVGDPSGKSATRKKLDRETVLKNAKTYEDQVFKILDPAKTQVKFNSDWLGELGTVGMIELASTFSVARMLERDDFEKRYKAETPISISEFLYPLLQGYDSVHLKCDIEMGGTDQKFNLLMGRHLQRIYGVGKEQAVFMMPLLVGTDGVNKMSKSLGNYIGVTDSPDEIYGKTLSISDELMWEWYRLLTPRSNAEIAVLKDAVASGDLHPKAAKESLAMSIVTAFYDEDSATRAKAEFDKIHKDAGVPSEVAEFRASAPIWVVKGIMICGLAKSSSEARRLIASNAFSIDGNRITDEQLQLSGGEYLFKMGKKNFARLIVS